MPLCYAASVSSTLGVYGVSLAFTDERCRFSELAGLPPCLARAAARVEGYLEGSTLRLFLHRQAPPCATGTLGLFAAYLPGVRPRTFCAIVVLGDLLWIPASAAVAEVLSARGLGEQQETSGLLSA